MQAQGHRIRRGIVQNTATVSGRDPGASARAKPGALQGGKVVRDSDDHSVVVAKVLGISLPGGAVPSGVLPFTGTGMGPYLTLALSLALTGASFLVGARYFARRRRTTGAP